MIHVTGDSLPYLRFNTFPGDGRVTHAIFTRQGGISPAPYDSLNLSISVADDQDNVFVNRSRAYGTHNRSNQTLVHAHLTHGSEIALVSPQEYGRYVGPVDGLITNVPGCGLTMNYADCAPIFLYDPDRNAIGLGHAGWKGVVKDLPGSLVGAMQRTFGSDPARLIAGIGPCIGPCCYEVGEPVISAVRSSFDDADELFVYPGAKNKATHNEVRPYFDLPEANRRQLVKAGVDRIELSDLCTACRVDLFFSHRAEKGLTGRFGALLVLSPSLSK